MAIIDSLNQAGMSVLSGLTKTFRKVIGSRNDRLISSMMPLVDIINSLEPQMEALADSEFPELTRKFRERLAKGETLDDILPEAFAAVREAAKRVIGLRHYDVQLLGGIVLHRGCIAEMVTGEGKTLVSTCPAYLNALQGHVNIVTVNDYLARRDSSWMGPVHEFLGLKVGCIQSEMDPHHRHPEYSGDITYGTNNEFGFDYLRDNMKTRREDQVQANLYYAIIDEVDSVLIDEARTPLIISGPAEEATSKYYDSDRVVRQLNVGTHFEVKEKDHQVIMTEAGVDEATRLLGLDNLYSGANMDWPHHLTQALRANHLYRREKDYVVKDGEVIIVDEFTGRMQPGRRWSDGLHQAIEAKEGLKIKSENQTLATITFQNYFRLYKKLGGMTGTAITEAMEFDSIYKLDVVVMPTNRPLRRMENPDVIYRTGKEKWKAVIDEIMTVHATGRPILVGTASIENSEKLSDMLTRRGIRHNVLNAKHHEREAHIVAEAGQPSKVTIATNMAGRGTDIILGPGVKEMGGLHIVGTERHEARRIDNQLRGRSGRQGDPGSSRFYLSLEDDLMRIFASDNVKWILEKLGMTEGVPIESRIVSKALGNAQKKVEAHNFDIRKNLLKYDEVMDKQRKTIYSLRQDILQGQDLRDRIFNWIQDTIFGAVNEFVRQSPSDPRLQDLSTWTNNKFTLVFDPEKWKNDDPDVIADIIYESAKAKYAERENEIGAETMRRVERYVMLETIDTKWKDHLYSMDHLRSGIGFEHMAQRDPLDTYKKEGFNLFEGMIFSVQDQVTDLLFRVRVSKQEEEQQARREPDQDKLVQTRHEEFQTFNEQREAALASNRGENTAKQIKRDEPKVGRNDPCPCGSGKKYKKCCGVNS